MMSKFTIREMVLCGLFIALITAGTFVRIPVGTDVYTLQFLATLLAGLVLGARLGAAAVGVYILLGLIGVPVFASGGGPGYVLQPTFGYLLGFVLQAYFCGRCSRRILSDYEIAVYPRSGYDSAALLETLREHCRTRHIRCRVTLINAPLVDISSTRIRRALTRGKDVSKWVM